VFFGAAVARAVAGPLSILVPPVIHFLVSLSSFRSWNSFLFFSSLFSPSLFFRLVCLTLLEGWFFFFSYSPVYLSMTKQLTGYLAVRSAILSRFSSPSPWFLSFLPTWTSLFFQLFLPAGLRGRLIRWFPFPPSSPGTHPVGASSFVSCTILGMNFVGCLFFFSLRLFLHFPFFFLFCSVWSPSLCRRLCQILSGVLPVHHSCARFFFFATLRFSCP